MIMAKTVYMGRKLYISLIILALSPSLVTCGSTPQLDKTSVKFVSESIVTPDTPKAPCTASKSFYTGSGGKGISLAILAPKTTGLTKDQEYIPVLVQGEFVTNFSGYSALSVMDRENLEKAYNE
jgi:hypothetical protein